jgi:hypothetical protein
MTPPIITFFNNKGGVVFHEPVFALKPADGAFGGHAQAAQRAYDDFRDLASASSASVGTRGVDVGDRS